MFNIKNKIMKGISKGLVFDTETATLVVSLKNCEYGDGNIYRTEKGNYFIENLNGDEGHTLEHLPTDDLEEIISEWKELGTVDIKFEEFELGLKNYIVSLDMEECDECGYYLKIWDVNRDLLEASITYEDLF